MKDSIYELIERFKNGKERFNTSATLNQVIHSLAIGSDPIMLLDQVISALDSAMEKLSGRYQSPPMHLSKDASVHFLVQENQGLAKERDKLHAMVLQLTDGQISIEQVKKYCTTKEVLEGIRKQHYTISCDPCCGIDACLEHGCDKAQEVVDVEVIDKVLENFKIKDSSNGA